MSPLGNNKNNPPRAWAEAHCRAVLQLTSAKHRLQFMTLLYSDDQIDAAAIEAVALLEKLAEDLQRVIPELPRPTPELVAEQLHRRIAPAESSRWTPAALDECYITRIFLPPFFAAHS